MILIFGNNEKTTLSAPISSSATTLQVFPGSGAPFPHPTAGQYFVLTLVDATTGTVNEIVWVTNVTGDIFTVIRGRENTVSSPWGIGDFVRCFPTAGTQAVFLQPDQYQSQFYTYAVASGTANALVASVPSTLTTIPNGMSITLKPIFSNTGDVTLRMALGSTIFPIYPILKTGGVVLYPGDIMANTVIVVIWNSFFSAWILQNPAQVQGVGLIGGSKDLKILIGTPSLTATVTASQIILQTNISTPGVNSLTFNAIQFSQSLNLTTVGAGGMDVGTPPLSSYLGIYAAYNPITNTKCVFAVDGTNLLSNTYQGAHLPPDYIYTALISVWPTDASGNLVVGSQIERKISIANSQVLVTSTLTIPRSILDLSFVVPFNATHVSGYFSQESIIGDGFGGVQFSDYTSLGTTFGVGLVPFNTYLGPGSGGNNLEPFYDVATSNSQRILFEIKTQLSNISQKNVFIFISGYKI